MNQHFDMDEIFELLVGMHTKVGNNSSVSGTLSSQLHANTSSLSHLDPFLLTRGTEGLSFSLSSITLSSARDGEFACSEVEPCSFLWKAIADCDIPAGQ